MRPLLFISADGGARFLISSPMHEQRRSAAVADCFPFVERRRVIKIEICAYIRISFCREDTLRSDAAGNSSIDVKKKTSRFFEIKNQKAYRKRAQVFYTTAMPIDPCAL